MTPFRTLAVLLAAGLLGACASAPKSTSYFYPDQVRDHEKAFARTMVDRDFEAFGRLVAEDAIFLNGSKPLRGKAQILQFWKGYFADKEPPFYWLPEQIEVLPTGNLAWTSGPVYTKDGKVFSRFHSVWRQAAPGQWRVVFDQGTEVCNCVSPISTAPAIEAAPLPMEAPRSIAPEPETATATQPANSLPAAPTQ